MAQTLLRPMADERYIATEIETRYAPELNDRFIRITRADGSVVYSSRIPADRSFNPARVPYPKAKIVRPEIREESPRDEAKMLIAAVPFSNGQASYLVEAGTSLSGAIRVMDALLWTLAAGLLTIMGLTILGAGS